MGLAGAFVFMTSIVAYGEFERRRRNAVAHGFVHVCCIHWKYILLKVRSVRDEAEMHVTTHI